MTRGPLCTGGVKRVVPEKFKARRVRCAKRDPGYKCLTHLEDPRAGAPRPPTDGWDYSKGSSLRTRPTRRR